MTLEQRSLQTWTRRTLTLGMLMWAVPLASAKETSVPTPAAEYELTVKSGLAFVRKAGSLERQIIHDTVRVPANSTLEIDSGASVAVSSSWGGSKVFDVEGSFLLPGRQRLDDVFGRMSVEGKLDTAVSPPEDKQTPARRLMAFFMGEFMEADSRASTENRMKSLLHPITIDSPGETHLIESPFLPVNVTLKWQLKEGQMEPHRVFVWTQQQMQYTPFTIAAGGSATVQLDKYGVYFWQVEDASGTFASAPRTIFVKSPNASLFAGTDAFAPIRILRPQQQTTVFSCLGEKNPEVSFWFFHDNPRLIRYEVFPKQLPGATIQNVVEGIDPSQRAAVLSFSKAGSYEFQIRGFEDPNPKSQAHHSAESSSWNIRVEDRCGDKRFLETFTGKEKFPDTGSVILF